MDKLSIKAKIVAVYYIGIVLYWLITYFTDIKFSQANYIYQFAFGLIPLLGGIGGILTAKKWGLLKSKLGKALFYISLGLISWGLGQMIWSYYVIFQNAEIPYPSFADLGYIFFWPLCAIGMINLSKATGAQFGFRKRWAKVLTVLIPLVILAISYYLLIVVARQGTLFPEIETSLRFVKVILDIGYPLGDVVILTLALLVFGLSSGYLGGKYRLPIYALLLGLAVNYFADFSFSYTTNAETYYNGHWVDLLFPTAMALLAFGVNAIEPPTSKLASVPMPTTPVTNPADNQNG